MYHTFRNRRGLLNTVGAIVVLSVFVLHQSTLMIAALSPLSPEQLKLFQSNINYFNIDSCATTSSASDGNSTASDSDTQNVDISAIVSKYKLQSAVAQKVGGAVVGSSNADKPPATPASSMKLIIADTLIRSGLSLNSHIKITSDMVYGPGFRNGDNPTLGDAMDQMLRVSGNTAANGIMEALGGVSAFTSKAQSYGYTNTDVKGYYQPANDGINKSTIGDQADAMSHIYTVSGSGYSQAQHDLEYAAKNDNHYSVDDDANKWAGTSQVAGNVAKLRISSADYIIGIYINEPDGVALGNGDIKKATADIAAAIKEGGDSASASDSSSADSSTSQCCSSSSSDSSGDTPSTKSVVNGGFSLEQVKTFASEPVTSTWNISDSTAEQWFLKQGGARATIGKYGLTSNNIGDITSAVKAANVSPAFFYLYTVNEGGGAGGFINHYGDEAAGGGVGNAKRDAQYLVDQSKTKGSPATGGGEPADMPTAEAKQILDALPSGSIGIVYIQATSAVTAELEDLSGKGPTDPRFGHPLSDSMQNIKTMGGDPQQGGAAVSTGDCATGGVAGEGIQKAISFAVAIAKNDGYGYDQNTRESGWQKWQSSQSCTNNCGSFDCSSLISAALTEAGYFKTNPNFATGTEGSELEKAGFKKVADSATTSKDLQAGDILIQADHTEMYIGNNKSVGAHINENGGANGGKVGDQTSKEISVAPFYDDNWTAVYRASN